MQEESKGMAEKGLSEQSKFDVKKSPRPETSEETQRPLADKASIKSDRGTFPTK